MENGPRVPPSVRTTDRGPGPACGSLSLASPVPALCPSTRTGARCSPDGAVPGPASTAGNSDIGITAIIPCKKIWPTSFIFVVIGNVFVP